MSRSNNSHESLSEVHASVDTTKHGKGWRKILAFMGPAYLVSVGYMDPGNWATDIAGGSQFGYKLLWVLLMSNMMALLLQSLSARLGIVRGRDLAQASRETYPRWVNLPLYFMAEIAIAATDLAEVLGMAIGLQLLFDIPLVYGVSITVLDSFLLLFLINFGMRKIEAFIIALVAIIGLAFLGEMILAKPDLGEVAAGLIPSLPGEAALYIAIGIIGATVMPHNLYLHSSLVQTRKYDKSNDGIKKAIRYNFFDSVIALNLAFLVNSAILILAASTFFGNGMFEVAEIKDAHHFLEPLLGSELAPVLFGVALVAAGQSSTITGTLAGQIVMEGYLNLRIQPWLRRLITRLIAIIPALFTILYFGEGATGKLLVLSQVVLSLQLGFAVIPLIHFVSDRSKMKEFTISRITKIGAWVSSIIIVSLNIRLVYQEISGWLEETSNPLVIWFTVIPISVLAFLLLLYIALKPFFKQKSPVHHGALHRGKQQLEEIQITTYHRIAVAVDFSRMDQVNINGAIGQGGKNAKYHLVHVVETAGAHAFGSETSDRETGEDQQQLEQYTAELNRKGYETTCELGFGNPRKIIPEITLKFNADLLVLGAHGHKRFKDIVHGTVVDSIRHRVNIPVLIVK